MIDKNDMTSSIPEQVEAHLTFGVGGIHRMPTRRQRQRVLREAFDAGFRSFDIAPAYGDGLNELELGKSLHAVRDEISITSKFGIPVRTYGAKFPNLFPLIRASEKLLNPSYGEVYSRRIFDVDEMRRSLDASLRRLKTDRIERYCIHEPLVPLSQDETKKLLEEAIILKQEGKILHFGVSGEHDTALAFAGHGGVEALQTSLDVFLSKNPSGIKCIAAFGIYRYFVRLREAGETDQSFVDFIFSLRAVNPGLELILATTSSARLNEWRVFFE